MFRHHAREVKLEVIRLYTSGYGSTTISKKLSISESLICEWINGYLHKGEEFLNKRPNVKATCAFRLFVVGEVLEKCLSYERVALDNGVSKTTVGKWVREFKSGGFHSLNQIKPRGRPPKIMGRPNKREPQTELEKLRYEVEYLRTENALLKKVRALVEERIARESGKKPKPSKN